MKLEPKVKKFQEGGAAPAPAAEPMPAEQGAAPEQGGGEGDPLMRLAQMAAEALQSGDCNTALAICEGFMRLVQEASQGQGGEAAPQGEPVYKRGGTLVRRV